MFAIQSHSGGSVLPSIPVIDFAPGRAGQPGKVAPSLLNALSDVGFCYLAGHGIPSGVLGAAEREARAFFRLPLEVKERSAPRELVRGYNAIGRTKMRGANLPDYKEYFQIGLELPEDDPSRLAGQLMRGPNQWPAEAPAFRQALEAFFDEVADCADCLLEVIAISLGADRHFFKAKYARRLQRTQAIFYPPHPLTADPTLYGVAPHTDYGCVTLLWQDEAGGLEVLTRSGEWLQAPPIPGTLLVNIGDLLQRWTSDRLVSNPHRVRNLSRRERLSIATFYDPDHDAVVDPIELSPPCDAALAYPPVRAGDYIMGRISASLKERSDTAEDKEFRVSDNVSGGAF